MYSFKVTISQYGAVFCDGIQVREGNLKPTFTATEIGTAILEYIVYMLDMLDNPFID